MSAMEKCHGEAKKTLSTIMHIPLTGELGEGVIIRVSQDDVSHWNVMPRSDYKSVSQWVRRIHIHKNLDFDIILVHFYTVMRIKILSGRTFYNANVTG